MHCASIRPTFALLITCACGRLFAQDGASELPKDAGPAQADAATVTRDCIPWDPFAASSAIAPESPGPFSVGAWSTAPGNDDPRSFWVAASPARDVTATKWSPCASARAGCFVQDIDWSVSRYGATATPLDDAVRLVGDRPYLMYERREIDPSKQTTPTQGIVSYAFVLQSLDGPTLFAAGRANDGDIAWLGGGGFGDDGIALVQVSDAPAREVMVTTFPYDKGSACTVKAPASALSLSRDDGPTGVVVGRDAFYFAIDPFGTVLARSDLTFERRWTGSLPRAFGERAALFGANAVTNVVSIVDESGDAVQDVAPQEGFTATGIAIDRKRSALVWAETRHWSETFVWTSPWPSGPRTSLGELPDPDQLGLGGSRMVANDGWIAIVTGHDTATILRASDGARWTVHAESGAWFDKPLWVDAQEVWLHTTTSGIESRGNGLFRLGAASWEPN